jgi:hypothetical protein
MDKVRLIPLERAELNDVQALQTLVYEHLERHTGQLLGDGGTTGGLLSSPSLLFNSANNQISFQSFAFCSIRAGADASDGTLRTPVARISRFDSGAVGHVGYPIDTSALQISTSYNLYARAVSIESDSEQRRQFSVATGLEESLTMNTRERERIEFSLVLSTSSPVGVGWVKIFNIAKEPSGSLSNSPLSLWDDASEKAVLRLETRIPSIMLNTSELLDNVARENSNTLGAVEMLALIRGQLARILYYGGEDEDPIAGDTSERWHDRPTHSLAKLTARANTLENALSAETTTRTTDVADLQKIKRVYARLYFHWSATDNNFNATLYDETGEVSVFLDGSALIGTNYSVGQVGITQADFIAVSKRPLLSFATLGQYEILNHSVSPLIPLNYTSAISNGSSSTDREPRPFSYALFSNDVENDIPEGQIVSGQPAAPAPSALAPTIITQAVPSFTDATDIFNQNSPVLTKAVLFGLSLDVRNDATLNYAYDITLTVRKVG